MLPAFTLHPGIDPASLRGEYASTGRVAIDPFLDSGSAMILRDHLLAREDWTLVMNAGDKVFEMPCQAEAALTREQRATLDAKVAEAATFGFQYRYDSIRVPDEQEARDRAGTALDRFASFISSREVVALLERVTGTAIDFADVQATGYRPGHFLTGHDDNVAGKNRSAAYVFGLTPRWRIEWGGLLLFHGEGATVDHGFVPAFNALRLFRVPAQHSVSQVVSYAPERRLSVTGWLRTRGQP